MEQDLGVGVVTRRVQVVCQVALRQQELGVVGSVVQHLKYVFVRLLADSDVVRPVRVFVVRICRVGFMAWVG